MPGVPKTSPPDSHKDTAGSNLRHAWRESFARADVRFPQKSQCGGKVTLNTPPVAHAQAVARRAQGVQGRYLG